MAKTPLRKRPVRARRTKTPDADGFISCVRYSREIAREIIRRISDGENWIGLANTEAFPSYSTLYDWRDRHPDFAAALRTARTIAADHKADRALQVAEAAKPASVTSDRLHYQALMKRAAFDAPERWSDKPPAPAKPEPVEIVFSVRHFEKVIGKDGKAYVRELRGRRRS